MIRGKRRWRRGELSRTIVLYCLRVLTLVLIWAVAVKTVAVVRWGAQDVSDVLVFAGGAFGGELLLLVVKRATAKKQDGEDGQNGTD
mgnify:CR=1 FL=1